MTDGNGKNATSNVIGQTINAPAAPASSATPFTLPLSVGLGGTISSTNNPVDVNIGFTLTANPTGGTSYTYVWYLNSVKVGTAQSLSETESSQGVYTFYCYITSGTYNENLSYTENVHAYISVTVSSSQQTVDVGQSFTLTATVTGGSAPISYQWESASGSDISGATSQTFTETPVAAGTMYFRANVIG